jgi:protein required for attachment to host cells
MKIPNGSIILVADGRKSLIFRNEGSPVSPRLVVEEKEVRENPPDREQASDAPGRAFSAAGSPRVRSAVSMGANHRSAYEETDFHELEESRFAVETSETLRIRALDNDYESLIVVAPPRTLGALRKRYHKEVEARLHAEVAKDLVNVPVPEIERILKAE